MKTKTKEIWKQIEGCEPGWEVSNRGNIKKSDGDIVIQHQNRTTGYVMANVKLVDGSWKMEYVHRLVAKAFIANPKNLEQVDHINNDRSDNSVSNLRFVSRKTNNRRKHAKMMKSRNHRKGQMRSVRIFNPKSGKTLLFRTQQQAADYIGCSRVLITKVLQDKVAHKAMGWEVTYADDVLDKKLQIIHKAAQKISKLRKRLAKWEKHKYTEKSEARI